MHRSFLFLFVAGFSGGLILAEYIVLALPILAGGVIVGTMSLWSKRFKWIGAVVLGLVLGLIRWQAWLAPTNGLEQFLGLNVNLSGVVMETTPRGLVIRQVEVGGSAWRGGLEINGLADTAFIGDHISAICWLEGWEATSVIRQRSHDIRARCFDPADVKTEPGRNTWRVRLALVRQGMIERSKRILLEPRASFLTGILLGDTAGMPPDVIESFRRTGTSHLVALSGFNVSIMIVAANAILIRVMGRRWAWLPALFGIIGFVIMTGASASVTRAATMSVIVLLASAVGRPILPARLLSYTLLTMIWHNPAILRHDLGFQLSFLATAGLLYVSKPLELWLSWIPPAASIRSSLSTTIAAMLATEPLLIWTFGRVAPIGILVNLFVLPFMPLAMAVGILALFLPPAQPLADALLRMILGVISWGADTPAASVVPPTVLAALIAAGCVVCIAILRRYESHQDSVQ